MVPVESTWPSGGTQLQHTPVSQQCTGTEVRSYWDHDFQADSTTSALFHTLDSYGESVQLFMK